MKFCKRELAAISLIGGLLPMAVFASEPEAVYPQRPITLVVGFTPGGGSDGLARIVAKHLGDELGQRVIIDNRPGAASNVAAEFVARAVPDGYTVYLSTRSNTTHKTMYEHLRFDMSKDLVPIGLLATVPNVIVTSAQSSIGHVRDVVALSEAHPESLTCASSGVGSTGHLLCELFQRETKTSMLHIAYKGSAPGFVDLAGGRVDLLFSVLPAALAHIQAGTARPIAVMSRQRAATIPQVPTLDETGFPGLSVDTWFGLMAPAGTPQRVAQRLNESINAVLLNPALQAAFMAQGYVAPLQPNTAETFGQLIAEETERWTAIARERGIRPG
ncbi:tripartite tricarboxylate transporter substrate binding protein [Bordetella genomosp. 11]|uniref:MFS transporter n=1 Tax=Bordetella genomosp. 11 TaxID=1416808 RepID=A0A261UHN3_9BORD|nr:tripartite tricarboxylate transporter substrate binding protein [Bordetella genomosp. 11]OZI61458.1 MFS transporter [Bordetella genomosp. 11]